MAMRGLTNVPSHFRRSLSSHWPVPYRQ